MSRCDYCEYRCSFECEDYKVSNEYMCDNFKLDFDALSDSQKKTVQKILMKLDTGDQYGYY